MTKKNELLKENNSWIIVVLLCVIKRNERGKNKASFHSRIPTTKVITPFESVYSC